MATNGPERVDSFAEKTPPECRRGPEPGQPHRSIPRFDESWSSDPTRDDLATPVEERLVRLAAAIGPLRRILAAIAARLVATRAYERLCYARLSDYARERPGVSARQLQELARVHRALDGLPTLERALVANALPWSKIRLVARVATAENEAAWIDRARVVPTRILEHEVRDGARHDAAAPPEDEPPQQRVRMRCTSAVREKWSVVCELAERVSGRRLGSGEVLELVAAEAFSEFSIDPAFANWPDEPPGPPRGDAGASQPPAGEPAARAPTRSLPHVVRSLAAGLEDTDAFELDRRLCRGIRLEQTLDAAIGPLLRVTRCAEYEWRGDYWTLPAYARDQLGMSARKARALLRLERAGDVCPELREAYRNGRISWVKAQCLLPLLLLDLDGEWRPVWVSWAARVTVRRLARDVERALLLRAGHPFGWQRCKAHPERAQDPLPPGERQLCAPDVDIDATQQLTWRVPRDVGLLFTAVQATLRARLESQHRQILTDGEVFDELLDRALGAWSLREPGTRRPDPVIERDGYRCAVPGCTSRRNLHDHHVTFRSAGGSDAPDNRITLCAFHHLRCLHTGWLRVHGRAPDELVFELGSRPEGPPMARFRSGDVALGRPGVSSFSQTA